MKHAFKTVFAIVLLLLLCCTFTSASAAADPEALVITDIAVTKDADNTLLQMTFRNAGSAAIDEFGLALAFIDDEGYQLFGYSDTLDGYTEEVCNWYYSPEIPVASGSSYATEDVFSMYPDTDTIAVAIRYYHTTDHGYVLLSESKWQWIWPGSEEQSGTLNRSYYTEPSDALYTSIGDFSPGYQYYLLDDFNAYYYDKNQGGEWITQIDAGSPAEMAGLQVGDLILFADGIKPTENMYAVEYAMAAITAGEQVDWVYERDGVIYVTRMAP